MNRFPVSLQDLSRVFGDDIKELIYNGYITKTKINKVFGAVVEILESLPTPLPVYRAIALYDEPVDKFIQRIKSGEQHKEFGDVGVYWSWDREYARPYNSEQAKNVVILEGEVDRDSVDWFWTVWLNILDYTSDYKEREIRLVKGAKVQLDKVWVGDKAIPVNKVVTAIRKTSSYKYLRTEYIPIERLVSKSEQSIEQTILNIKDGIEGSKTDAPIMVTDLGNGTYSLDDGFHRVAEALLKGETEVEAEVYIEDFSDYVKKISAFLQYESDNIRLGYIKEALSGTPVNSEDLVTIEVADDYILYEEEWVDACWEALYQKADYKGLGQNEAIAKFMKERFAQIVAETGENILDWEFDGDTMYVKISRSGMEKTSKLNLNTIRQFFTQERDRGVVDDKILNELQVDLIVMFKQIYDVLLADSQLLDENYNKFSQYSRNDMCNEILKRHPEFEDYNGNVWEAVNREYSHLDAEEVVEVLEKAKTDKQRILAINRALNEAHHGGFILGEDYNSLRSSLGKLKTLKYTDKTITSPEELFKLSTENPEEGFDNLVYQDDNVDALLYIVSGGRLEIHNWDRTGGSATETLKRFRKMFPEIVAVGVEESSDSQSYWNHMLEKGLINGYYTYGMEFIDTVMPIKKTAEYNDQLSYTDPEVPMTDEDIENINTTDAVPTQNAMDMTKIPHPEAFKEVESKGVFFIGGDSVNVDPRGDETPFGIDYPNHFNGWAVGANVGQKLKKKADEGYYYVAVVSYPSNSSMHANPSFISAMERKLKSLCQYVGVSYTQVVNEAEHYFQEQEAEKQKEELKTKKKTTGQDALFEEDALVGNKEVKKDLTFYKKVIDLLKKREVEDIKERGGNVRNDAKISIKNVLLEVETEISHKNTEQYKGNIVGVAKFAEVITGKDRVVKHEVYPEEIIFNNWKQLPEPIPVAELFSALESKVKPEDIQKTFWVMLQTYNLTVGKDHPIAQFLMDFADEGIEKTSGITKGEVLYRIGDIPEEGRFYVTDRSSLEDWKKYIGENEVRELKVSKFYIPQTEVSFNSFSELQKAYDDGKLSDNLISRLYPEESGITNLLQVEVDRNDIVSIVKTSGSNIQESEVINIPIKNENNRTIGEVSGVLHYDRRRLYNWLEMEKVDQTVFSKLDAISDRNLLPVAILKSMNVSERQRGKGYGGEALEEFENEVIGAKYIFLISDTGELNKFDLTNWYKRNGFNELTSGDFPLLFKKTSGIEKTARRARQDDSLPVIKKLISMGYDKALFHTHELLHKEVDICDSYNGRTFDLKQMVSNLRYNAPIFEHSHVNCYCYLICTSTTNPDLDAVIVDWTGIEEGGRVVDRADAGERKEDFERLFNNYRESLDNIENNSYIHGEFGEPEAGIYSFDLTMYDDTYFNVNELQEIRDKVLELVLDRADRYGITVEDAEIAGNHMIVQTSAMLRNYDFSKEDWVEVEWTYNKRREELVNVIMDLSKLQDWLKVTQDSINNLLLQIEQKNANQQMDKFSKKDPNQNYEIWWHGSPSGNLKGGTTGLHLGTYQSAKEALEARIGIPVEGEWDGTREYGKTLLMGQNRMDKNKIWCSGINCDAPKEDYYPTGKATFSDGTPIPLDSKPNILPYKIKGRMSNSPYTPHPDFKANGYMRGQIKKGNPKSGYYYENVAEDAGSISIVVPNGDHLEPMEVVKKTSKLNLNTIRQFFTQERDRGVVDDKVLDELQVDLIILFKEIYPIQEALYLSMFTGEEELIKMGFEPDPDSDDDNWDNKMQWIADRTGEDPSDERASFNFSPKDIKKIIKILEKAKSDKEKIIAINYALNEAHTRGFLVDMHLDGYNKLRQKLGAIQAHHMRFIVAGRVDFLREKFIKEYVENYMYEWVHSTPLHVVDESKWTRGQLDLRNKAEQASLEKANSAFDQLVEADPTKNKQYLQWLIKQFNAKYEGGRELGRFMEDLPKIKSYLEAYYKLSLQRKDLGTEEKRTVVHDKEGRPKLDENGKPIVNVKTLNLSNIDHIENWQKLQDIVKPYLYGSGVEISELEKEILKEEANLVFDGKDWQIWVPHTEKSACILGKGTEWCTTYGYEGGNHPTRTGNKFDNYKQDGDLIIIINKQKPDWKYQWHFESDQFMNRDDQEMDIKTFLDRDAQELKEPLHDYLIERQEEMPDEEYSNYLDNDHPDVVERKIDNLLKVDAPFEKIKQLIDMLPKKDRVQFMSSAKFLPEAVKTGAITEKQANKFSEKTDLLFKNGQPYWIVDDWSSGKILDLFSKDYKNWAKDVFNSNDYDRYSNDLNVSNYYSDFDVISKDNLKRIELYLKSQGVKVGKLNASSLEKVISEVDDSNVIDIAEKLESVFNRGQDDADHNATYRSFVEAIEQTVGGKSEWLKVGDKDVLAFPVDPSRFSSNLRNNMSELISDSLKRSKDLITVNDGYSSTGDIREDGDIDYLNDRLSEELDDLGAPEIPVKPIKKVRKAINKILREGIFRKKSMLEKLSRLGGFTVEAEKIIDVKRQKVPDALKRSVLDMLEEMNSNRDYSLTFHFKQQLKARAPEHEQNVLEFIKTHTYVPSDVSEVQLDDKGYFRKLLFEIRTPANVTGVEDVIYLVVNESRGLVTFFSKSSTGQRQTTPQRYAKPSRVTQEV